MVAPHIVIFGIGVAICTAVYIASASYQFYRNRQHQYDSHNHFEGTDNLRLDRRILGPCGICDGGVSSIDGYQAPCNHYVHYTCANGMKKEFPNFKLEWSQVCPACLKERMKTYQEPQETELRNRTLNSRECANCQCKFEDGQQDIRTLECSHRVHGTCWIRMQNSGSPTCPSCMDM